MHASFISMNLDAPTFKDMSQNIHDKKGKTDLCGVLPPPPCPSSPPPPLLDPRPKTAQHDSKKRKPPTVLTVH